MYIKKDILLQYYGSIVAHIGLFWLCSGMHMVWFTRILYQVKMVEHFKCSYDQQLYVGLAQILDCNMEVDDSFLSKNIWR